MNDNQPPNPGDFILYAVDGREAVHASETKIDIDWPAVEELAQHSEDTSPRARNVARLLLFVRDNVQSDEQCVGVPMGEH